MSDRATDEEGSDNLLSRDHEVEPIMRSVYRARLDLERILSFMDDWSITSAQFQELRQWLTRHASVMDFCFFKEVTDEYMPDLDENDPMFGYDEVQTMLEDCDAGAILDYADEKLGIKRGYQYWDGQYCCGVNHERANGSWQDVVERFERAVRGIERSKQDS